MNIEERIQRRRRPDHEPRVVRKSDALNPIAHPADPTGRALEIEQLLDAFDPVFDGQPPADCYVWGPKGAGKSAVIRALFVHLDRLIGRAPDRIYTTTRAEPTADIAFVYVDGRAATTGFALLHAVLSSLSSDPVPKKGVGTDALRAQLRDRLAPDSRYAVVAVDHVEEPKTLSVQAVYEQFDAFGSSVTPVLSGRSPPDEIEADCLTEARTVRFGSYRQHMLVEILAVRQTDGLSNSAVTHDQLRGLAAWANGDAHDALAALFSAGLIADENGHERITPADLSAGMDAVPHSCVSLGRVLALPESRQQVLCRLLALSDADCHSVGTAADAIADERVDLSRATIERVLYELAEVDIVRRLKVDDPSQAGRPPSRLEPRFPTLVFSHLAAACP